MILKVLEIDYKGFHLVLNEEGKRGWKCVIGDMEYLFPNEQAAEAAIRAILKNADEAIAQYGGTKIRKVDDKWITKTVEVENPY